MLAWRRITTATDARYKKYFRRIYEAYELASDANIDNLYRCLKSGTYFPSEPIRFYYPKPSGLQRPITLLSVEDQVVLQALANVFSGKIYQKRKPLLANSIFSNWENESDSIFFLQDWKKGFGSLRRCLLNKFKDGYQWMASFDLSAFYDTIDHGLLLKVIAPRGGDQKTVEDALTWLKVWSSDKRSRQYGHGIPQGPLASNYLAEAFMLPIDLRMSESFVYARYVDDIRILGKNSTEVRKALVTLDRLCRERGLIPNAGKFTVREIKFERDLIADIPDLFAYFLSDEKDESPQDELEKMIFESVHLDDITGNFDIVDKSKLRYALFRIGKSERVLQMVLNIFRDFPEHIDVYSVFFENYQESIEISNFALHVLSEEYPYDYVRGELWKLLARMVSREMMFKIKDTAIQTIQGHYCGIAEKIGIYSFLCSCDKNGLGAFSRWVEYEENSLVQALVAPYIDLEHNTSLETVQKFLSRSLPDVGLSLIDNIIESSSDFHSFGISEQNLPIVTANSYHAVGIISKAPLKSSDPIALLLADRFAVKRWNHWKEVFGSEYTHAHQILVFADKCFQSHKSEWLGNQDSFNNILFRCLITMLVSKKIISPVTLSDTRGLIDYGKLLNDTHEFMSRFPIVAHNLLDVHNRRRTIPSSHPYDKKTGIKASPVRKREQGELVDKLNHAYTEMINLINTLI